MLIRSHYLGIYYREDPRDSSVDHPVYRNRGEPWSKLVVAPKERLL